MAAPDIHTLPGHTAPVPPTGNGQAARFSLSAGAFLRADGYGRLVSALVHRGHGVEALCFMLALARDALLDLIIQLDLPTPPDVAFRPRSGANAWTQDDYRRLLKAWECHWKCGAIAETLGRSKSSIWAKARRLGLPARDRRSLTQPVTIAPARCRRLDSDRLQEQDVDTWPPSPDVMEWLARGTDEVVWVRRKPTRTSELEWPKALRDHVAMRGWSGQRNEAIARDLGISLRAVTSMKCRMHIPPLPRAWLSDVYRPEKAAEHIAALGYVERPCRKNPEYTYWLQPRKHTRARRDVAAGFYLGEN